MPIGLALVLLAAAPFVLLALAAPARAQGTLPDLRITLRQESTDTPGGFATEILYIKGDRQRRDVFVKAPEDAAPRHVETVILQCDRGRTLNLFPEHRTYAERRPPLAATVLARARVAPPHHPDRPSSPRPLVTGAIQTVDTGERRQLGTRVARRLVETRTLEPQPALDARAAVYVIDGWYIDVPDRCSGIWAPGFLLPQAILINVHWRGRDPARGFAIEQTVRVTRDDWSAARTTTLTEFVEAPLDDEVFAVPRDYRRALWLPDGMVDPTRPDTLRNRVEAYWMWLRLWVRQWG